MIISPTGFIRTLPTWLWPILPWISALACFPLSWLCPMDQVWGQVLSAGFLMAPRWLLFLSPLWLLFWWGWTHWRMGRSETNRAPASRKWLLLSFPGLALGGPPPDWVEPHTPPDGTIRLVTANVNSFSDHDNPEEMEAVLGALAADVVVVIEQRATAIPGMRLVAHNFDDDLPRISHATAVFCREDWTCEARVTAEFGSDSMKMPMGIVRIPDAQICLLGMHAPPPIPYDPSGILPYVREIARHIDSGRVVEDWLPCQVGDRVLLSGDLNAVPWSEAWSMLLHQGLSDRLITWGVWGASWPAGGGWPNFPFFQLDHLLVGPVDVPRVQMVRIPGSDHKALVMDVAP